MAHRLLHPWEMSTVILVFDVFLFTR